jgi:5-methylcytosine-specific restriction endonuclease McrA
VAAKHSKRNPRLDHALAHCEALEKLNLPRYSESWLHTRRRAVKRYEARRRGWIIVGTHTLEEWLSRLAEYKNRCAYCQRRGTKAEPLTRDHKIPITKGGTDFIDNVVPACRSCNSAKKDR